MKTISEIENLLKTKTKLSQTFVDKATAIIDRIKLLVVRQENIDEILNKTNELNRCLQNEYNRLNKIGECPKTYDSNWKCDVKKDDDTYVITFNQLLPQKDFFTYAQRSDIRAMQNALKEALLKVPLEKYNGRVVIQIIHHFTNKMTDYDNLGFKAAVDVIALYLLKDDNPKHMALYQDYIDDINDYTEIIISPVSVFREQIANMRP